MTPPSPETAIGFEKTTRAPSNVRFVLVSNRGHNSIAVFAIRQATTCGEAGYLRVVKYCHTKGKTPRHFQFDPSGNFLLSANQDTDSITIFRREVFFLSLCSTPTIVRNYFCCS